MTFTRTLGVSTLAAGLGVAGLLGVGLGTASADPWSGPGQGCDRPGAPPCGRDYPDDWRNGPVDWHNRGINEGRNDHQPFNWNGQQVDPVFDQGRNAWGFWFLNQWIPM
jgi:hypothetical protein